MPPAFLNHRVPTACGTPTPTAASSLAVPAAIAAQNRRRSSRPATGGRPGENKRTRPERSERRFRMFIATPVKVLRRPLESAQRTAIRMMDDVVGLSGHERHVESVEHDAGLQVGREGPSDDPARPGVENDREVEKTARWWKRQPSAASCGPHDDRPFNRIKAPLAACPLRAARRHLIYGPKEGDSR